MGTMNKKKKIGVILIVLTMIFLGSGCMEERGLEHKEIKLEEDTVVIGFLMDTLNEERWQKDRDIFVAEVEKQGAKVLVQAANGSDEKQLSQAENLLENGIDVMVLIPHNQETGEKIVSLSHKKNVPVLCYDRLAEGDVDYYISFDNINVGRLQAEYITEKLGITKGNFVYIGGASTDNNALLFKAGVMEVLKKYPEINLVYNVYTQDWQPSEAQKHIEQALKETGNDIQAIICANDGTADGVSLVLNERQLRIPLTGMDAEIAAAQRIVEGRQSMTVYKNIQKIAGKAADIAVRLAQKKPIETQSYTENKTRRVPTVLLEVVTVDKENIDEILIKSGFHKEIDVYRKFD